MVVDVKTAPRLELGLPKPLFTPRMYAGGTGPWFRYAVAPDGKRFLIITQVAEQPSPITVVLNWRGK
jgi:hypothetical protein